MCLCFWCVYIPLGWRRVKNRLLVFFFFIEMFIITIFAYNILEATYAIKYPRAPLPQPTPSAATKSKSGVVTSPTPKRAFKVLSPNVRLFNLTCTSISFLTTFYLPNLLVQPSTAETFWVFSIFFSYRCFHHFFAIFN